MPGTTRSGTTSRALALALVSLLAVAGCVADQAIAPPDDLSVHGRLQPPAAVPEILEITMYAGDDSVRHRVPLPEGVSQAYIAGAPLAGTAGVDSAGVWYMPRAVGLDEMVLVVGRLRGTPATALVRIRVAGNAVLARGSVVVPSTANTVYRPTPLDSPDLDPVRPLVAEILHAYGDPSSPLDRARAIRDWVARTAIHPYPWLHYGNTTANSTVLPAGVNWNDVNGYVVANHQKSFVDDNVFWESFHGDAVAMLDTLLGSRDPATGARRDDGIMQHVQGAQYRMRTLDRYRFIQCSSQERILVLLWRAAGLHGMLISTIGHDPAAVYIPSLGWVYEDPTYDEEFTLHGSDVPLSPVDLMALSRANRASVTVESRKMTGPSWSPDIYVSNPEHRNDSYFREHPNGMVHLGSQVNSRFVAWLARNRLVQINVPDLHTDPVFGQSYYTPVTPSQAFPDLGAYVDEGWMNGTVAMTRLGATWPGLVGFEWRGSHGVWQPVADPAAFALPESSVDVRPVDSAGHHGTSASITRRDVRVIATQPARPHLDD